MQGFVKTINRGADRRPERSILKCLLYAVLILRKRSTLYDAGILKRVIAELCLFDSTYNTRTWFSITTAY